MILMSIYSVPMYLGSDRLEFLRGGVQWMMFQVMKGKKERKSLNHQEFNNESQAEIEEQAAWYFFKMVGNMSSLNVGCGALQ